jgi:hypothetical protein
MPPEVKISRHRDGSSHGQEPQNAPGAAVVLARDPEEGKAGHEGSGQEQPDGDVDEDGHESKLPETIMRS